MDALREYLKSSTMTDHGSFQIKKIADRITCGDGTEISVQASSLHFCEPKEDRADWTRVEVMFMGNTVVPIHFEIDTSGIGAYVPIENVAAEIYDRRDRSNEL